MIQRTCLVIDNGDGNDVSQRLTQASRNKNIELTCITINPEEYYIVDEDSGDVDLKKLYRKIKQEIDNGITFIACDNGLGVVQGFELIYRIRADLKYRQDAIIYSGNIRGIINQINQSENPSETLRKLVLSKISNFFDRDANFDYINNIIDFIHKQTFNCSQEILNWLNQFKDYSFQDHPDFHNKTLGEISVEIESNTDLGIYFQKIIIEHGISVLFDLNSRKLHG